ncbi:MAG: LemA family protein [Planctomycetes bacterium ADurb.Bin412]|nr:MAG: LemA family protein [Planctomycetes bacterium ADurb.Bin412]
MKRAILVIVVILVIMAVGFGIGYTTKYNHLVGLQEKTNEGRSRFAAAVNTCSQKMKSVWAMADQEGILEKETYTGVAKARSAYDESEKAFQQAKEEKSASVMDLTKLGAGFGQALVNVRIAFEAYPQLRTTETYQKAMAAVEEGFNEIKTALDDWIGLCQNYNRYRRTLFTNWFASAFSWPFPPQIAYYEGGIKEPEQWKITTEELNPKANDDK